MKTYAEAGVDREGRREAKKNLKDFELTYSLSKYGEIVKTPFNVLYPIARKKYQVKTCDGIGTKVLLGALANKHDTIGIDAIAMVANDCIRCGANPIAITDVIDIKKSEPWLLKELQKGLIAGTKEAGCPLIGGETADVPELLNTAYHINCDCVGDVNKKNIIDGKKIKPGDAIIGLPSSGIHSNGLTLVRKVLFKEWGGKFDAFDKLDGLERELIFECLKPTTIYVKEFFRIVKRVNVLGAVHITGDAYLKFQNLTNDFGFEFFNFNPHPIFDLIQKTGKISDEEMFKTFNMGRGFAVVVRDKDIDQVLNSSGSVIGRVTDKKEIKIYYKKRIFVL